MDANVEEAMRLLDDAALNLNLARGVLDGAEVITEEEAAELSKKLGTLVNEARMMLRERARDDRQEASASAPRPGTIFMPNNRPMEEGHLKVLEALDQMAAFNRYSARTKPEIKARFPQIKTSNWRSLIAGGLLQRIRSDGDYYWRWYLTDLGMDYAGIRWNQALL
jgi:hypothetical protein